MTVPALQPALASPVEDAYTRLAEVFPGLRVRELTDAEQAPVGGGWVGAGELAAGGDALDAFLAWDNAQVLRDYGQQARPDVIAGFGLHRYAWPACLLITVPWFLHRRVPRVPVEDVAFQRTLGRMTVRVREFACLPDDPAAQLPGARVVADEEALRAGVRAAVAEHIEPVLDGFGPRMRRGKRALWGMATDEVVEGLWYIAHLLGEEQRAVVELEQLLPDATRPYVGTAGFRELTGPNGELLPTRDRASCCLFYTLRPEDTCVTCPRTCDADRAGKLQPSA
ncbi:(2Fe-2S)-binding protein [Streptomyces lunaelactis]|uniref:(2Fe-2S)-binding protein n=1 Tax=Streptomyces lunaelactis TaxID=1535768 RepID=UPI00158557B3|nr:(2Fe-2S)-binding protein [Streptomyces lunaelactis]NUK38872.1 (2Fe-2S)-binding protein [Streptomyces lunaelactis]NUK45967.1 (2Fe-2S)-binding protein [Streptomyces lunaelactis]NUK75529.1 (2Fe-2S)-binding protein [Streptomyces lunaelactis]NUK80316.1 (2Fe-2S)-binding protein [Streptomyces lunaelactis]NUK96805.1 (2Fe-2S)-binding protein [Streptomyces lunaelactis]